MEQDHDLDTKQAQSAYGLRAPVSGEGFGRRERVTLPP